MKRGLLLLSVFLTLVSSPLARAEAQPLTDQYIASIRVGCTDALQGILQVQKSEAATRVNRGREYETILRLTAAFNSRIVLNKLDAPALTSTSARMQAEFSDFQQHYLDYAEKIDATLKINCKEAPVTFYDNLTAVREARARVATDVRDMEALLGEYQKGLDALKGILSSIEQGVSQ
jgi:hypothetical protein